MISRMINTKISKLEHRLLVVLAELWNRRARRTRSALPVEQTNERPAGGPHTVGN